MTEAEKLALAMVNEIGREPMWKVSLSQVSRNSDIVTEALCRAIEQHEVFKRQVSEFAFGVKSYMAAVRAMAWQDDCSRFIIPKTVDPLLTALNAAFSDERDPFDQQEVSELRQALKACGLQIVETEQ